MFDKLRKDRCYIIAEIGGNFRTSEEAKKLVDAAKLAGVDAVKLQTFSADTMSVKDLYFDMENTGRISQYEYFKKYEISKEIHQQVFNYIESKGLDWFSTPSHQNDVDLLLSLGVKVWKIGADDATNFPLLKYLAGTGLPVILSTGMCTMEEVRWAVNLFLEEGVEKVAILHTVSAYPCTPELVNLNVLHTLQKEFPQFFIGYSDHTLTPLAAIAAVCMGATIIERHFTLDKNAEGPDHILSSTPEEMKYLVDSIREIERMRGAGIKAPIGPEVKNRANNRKSIVAVKDIKKGERLSKENIGVKRPGTGISPMYYDQLLGKTSKRDLDQDELIAWGDLV